MKWIFPLFLVLLISQSKAQENANPFDIKVSIAQIEGRFHIQASYAIPMNICNAFAFITDYEGAKISQVFWRPRSFLERVTKFGFIE